MKRYDLMPERKRRPQSGKTAGCDSVDQHTVALSASYTAIPKPTVFCVQGIDPAIPASNDPIY